MMPHAETYDHLGEIACGVYDLPGYEQHMRESTRVYIQPQEADFIYEHTLPGSPELLWSFIIDPDRRLQWQNIKKVINTPNSSGRMGVDSVFHCDHGSFTRVTRMLDWRPFHYMTNVTVQTFHMFPMKGAPCEAMFEFIPVDGVHPRVIFRTRSLRREWLGMRVMVPMMRRMLQKEYSTEFTKLEKLLAYLTESF
jgi:hypothetical protein